MTTFQTNSLYRHPSQHPYGFNHPPPYADPYADPYYGSYPAPQTLFPDTRQKLALEQAAAHQQAIALQQQSAAYQQAIALQQQAAAYPQPAYAAYQRPALLAPQPGSLTQQLYLPSAQEPNDPKVKNLQILDKVLQSDRPTKKLFRNYLRAICKTRGVRLPGKTSKFTSLRGLHGLKV